MADYLNWSIEDVCVYLELKGLPELRQKVIEEEIDGKVLVSLTESMVASLCNTMRKQVMLLEIIKNISIQSAPQAINNLNNLENVRSQTIVPCEDVNNMELLIETMKPWPVRYQLPCLPPLVVAALDAKDGCFLQYQRNSCRNHLLQCLYDDISKYTMYPSSTQYSDVVAAICSKYPYLNDFPSRSSSPHRIGICPTLIESLKNKFKKERAPLIHLDVVAEHKKKFGQLGRGRKRKDNADDQLCARKVRDLLNTLPVGEDETTVATHHRDMKTEYSKLRPDINMLLDCQHRSWLTRAKDFEFNLCTVDLKANYPWLSIPRLFLNEMKLRFSKDLKELHQWMGAMGNDVVNLAKSKYKDEYVVAISAEIRCHIKCCSSLIAKIVQ
ncbi:sterile alpha motif domain-containing protein 3-like isoform X2 [Hydra vulgaris]|uniref:Sterile alpha motif domain-containing protein 3-like isoform X2 n=1 Tax=Hydra vulgaris TaxID=6087 RepID=A0ABM4CX68_HYDVU